MAKLRGPARVREGSSTGIRGSWSNGVAEYWIARAKTRLRQAYGAAGCMVFLKRTAGRAKAQRRRQVRRRQDLLAWSDKWWNNQE
jgi:hypothetical protein